MLGSKIGSSIGKLIGKAIDSFSSESSDEQKDAISSIKDLINQGLDPQLILMTQDNKQDRESIISILKNLKNDVSYEDKEKINNLLKFDD